jgi:hypothetical protein
VTDEDIEEYWDVVRPDRAVEDDKLVMEDIQKLSKDVLCMGLAVMLNKGAGLAAELNRLTKTTLLDLTLLVKVPLEVLNGFSSAIKEVKAKAKPEYFRIIPSEQVEAARARILQPQTTCNSCGVVATSPQRLCDSCREATLRIGQFRRRRSGY